MSLFVTLLPLKTARSWRSFALAALGRKLDPKTLVSAVQAALQTNRLVVSKKLSEANLLVAELQNFRAEISDTGRDTFEARSGAPYEINSHR